MPRKKKAEETTESSVAPKKKAKGRPKKVKSDFPCPLSEMLARHHAGSYSSGMLSSPEQRKRERELEIQFQKDMIEVFGLTGHPRASLYIEFVYSTVEGRKTKTKLIHAMDKLCKLLA